MTAPSVVGNYSAVKLNQTGPAFSGALHYGQARANGAQTPAGNENPETKRAAFYDIIKQENDGEKSELGLEGLINYVISHYGTDGLIASTGLAQLAKEFDISLKNSAVEQALTRTWQMFPNGIKTYDPEALVKQLFGPAITGNKILKPNYLARIKALHDPAAERPRATTPTEPTPKPVIATEINEKGKVTIRVSDPKAVSSITVIAPQGTPVTTVSPAPPPKKQ